MTQTSRPEPVIETPLEIPATKTEFGQFGVAEEIVDALAMRNINGTFPIQAMVLKDALAGKDVLAKSRTGSGKTLAFAIPIVQGLTGSERGPSALILTPTRELATQVALEFRGIADVKRLKVATVYGGVGINEQAKKASKSQIIVATPGRLIDLVGRKLLRLDGVSVCVLDEADRMLDMGFLPDVSRILGMLPAKRQSMMFSATLDGEVGRLASRYTKDPVLHEVIEARPVVAEATHRFLTTDRDSKTDLLVRELAAGERGLVLIFTRTKRAADRVARTLKNQGFKAQALHGDMTQPARERTLARFESGKADVLVATEVAARGLDLDHITHVVNFDPPEDDKAYVHRAGRTARAGRAGEVITLLLPDQVSDFSRLAQRLKLETELGESDIPIVSPRVVFRSRGGGTRGRGRRRR